MRKASSNLLFVIGVAALGGAAFWVSRKPKAAPAGSGRPPYMLPVTLATVTRGRLEPRVLLTGSVGASQHSRLGFRIGGRLAAIEVLEGARVEAGSPLARLEDSDQRVALSRARASLELAQRQLALSEAGVRSEERLRLAAELEQRRAEEQLARSDFERNQPLAGNEVISKSRLDSLEAAWKAAGAQVVAAEQRLAEAQAGTRAEELEIARAQVALRQAELEAAHNELSKTVLSAPFAARVVSRQASLGEEVAAGAPILEVVDLASREIDLEVPARHAAQIDSGSPVHLSIDEDPDFELDTKIDALIVFADEATRNFRALVRLEESEDPDLHLKPGMFVRARVEMHALDDALLVPDDALRKVESGLVLVRAKPPAADAGSNAGSAAPAAPAATGGMPPMPSAEWVPVRLLASADGKSAVQALQGELAAGESVVVSGVDLAFPGVPLMPAPGPSSGGGEGAAGTGDPRHAGASGEATEARPESPR